MVSFGFLKIENIRPTLFNFVSQQAPFVFVIEPRTFQHKIFQFRFIKNQQRREATASKEAKPPRPPKQTEQNVNTPPIDNVPSLWTNKPTSAKI
jgi:hypothetical protein